MSGLRVLHVLDECDRGGAETLVRNICAESLRLGLRYGLCTFRGGTIAEEIRATGVEFHRIGRRLPIDPLTILRLRRLVVGGGFDVVHCHQQVTLLHARVALAGLPVVLCCTHHGLHHTDNRKDLLTRKALINRVDANIFVSNDQLEYYKARYDIEAPARVVYNAIDNIRPVLPTGAAPRSGTPTLLMVGHFNGVRDQMLVCRSMAVLASRGVPFRMRFAGLGNRPELHEACVEFCRTRGILDRVEFLGPRSDVPGLMMESDAFVYASFHDTFGIALAEAMACGLPVVVNDLPVFQEIFGVYDSVSLFESGSPESMAGSIETLLADLPAMKGRARVHAEAVRRNFSLERLIAELEGLYLSVDRWAKTRSGTSRDVQRPISERKA